MDKIVDSRVEEILDKLAKDTIEKKNTFLEKWLKSKWVNKKNIGSYTLISSDLYTEKVIKYHFELRKEGEYISDITYTIDIVGV